MNHLIATLSAAGSDNWKICKRVGLWGTPASNSHAKCAIRTVQPGDRLFVWQSKAGLLATARVAALPVEFTSPAEIPWPNCGHYRFGVPIDHVQELAIAIPDKFPEYRSTRFGLQSYQVQAGLTLLKDQQYEALQAAFD